MRSFIRKSQSFPSGAAIEWISRLIAIDTTSRFSNLTFIREARSHLEQFGFSCRETMNAAGTKANLFATLPGESSAKSGGLILSGHTDVVPVDGQNWCTEPFEATVVGDRLFGRGACDMKGFIGTVLGLVPTFRQMHLKRPLHVALSFDEELGCVGAPLMIQDFVDDGIRPELCIVGEPTLMAPIVAHKAIRVYRCSIKGVPGHSSNPAEGVNAIARASDVIQYLLSYAHRLGEPQLRDENFDPPYSTMVVTRIGGGTAVNIIPEHCDISFECRALPDSSLDVIEEQLRLFIEQLPQERVGERQGASSELHRVASVPALSGELRSAVKDRIVELLGQDPGRVSFASEAGQFEAAGIPTIVCGPGSIAQAHKENEWVSLSQIAACENMLQHAVAIALSSSEPR